MRFILYQRQDQSSLPLLDSVNADAVATVDIRSGVLSTNSPPLPVVLASPCILSSCCGLCCSWSHKPGTVAPFSARACVYSRSFFLFLCISRFASRAPQAHACAVRQSGHPARDGVLLGIRHFGQLRGQGTCKYCSLTSSSRVPLFFCILYGISSDASYKDATFLTALFVCLVDIAPLIHDPRDFLTLRLPDLQANPDADTSSNFWIKNSYEILSFSYQLGVLISRSSVSFVRIRWVCLP